LYSKDGNASARQLYERAIGLDPNYAAAYAGLAETYLHEWFLGSSAALDQAFELAQKAKALDQSLPLVHEALSSIHLFKKQHEEALAAARRWVEIEPNSADGYANLAGILQFAGEPEQVIALIEKAMRLNPFYPFYYTLYMGQAYLSMRRYEEAIEVIKRSVVRNPESMHGHLYLAACYGHLGKDAPAREELAEVRRIHLDFSTTWVQTFMPYKRVSDLDMLVDGLRKAGLPE
jgi:adenylate cyclase